MKTVSCFISSSVPTVVCAPDIQLDVWSHSLDSVWRFEASHLVSALSWQKHASCRWILWGMNCSGAALVNLGALSVVLSKSSFILIPGGLKSSLCSVVPAVISLCVSPLHSLPPRLSPGGTSLSSPAWRGFKWVTFETIRGAPARTNAEWRAAAPGSWWRRLLALPVDYIDPLKQWGPPHSLWRGINK